MPAKNIPLFCWYCSRPIAECKAKPCKFPDYPVTIFKMENRETNYPNEPDIFTMDEYRRNNQE